MKTLRILVADDHYIVREGLRRLLGAQPGWKVVGEAVNGREAVEKTKRLKPGVVVLDLTMPELDGLEAARQILEAAPGTRILILTVHESQEAVSRMLKAGVRGYVLKTDAGRSLVAAVRALSENKFFLTPKVSEMFLASYACSVPEPPAPPSPKLLTPRESQIVLLLAEGKSNREVAAELRMSVRTAETHRMNIMRKLHLNGIGELIRYAIRSRLVEP